MSIWDLWRGWEGMWITPWAVASIFAGIYLIREIQWTVKFLPLALAYILVFSVPFAFDASNFELAPSTMGSLLALFAFLGFCAMKFPHLEKHERLIRRLGYLGLVATVLVLVGFLVKRPDSAFLMPFFWNRSMGGFFTVMALAPTRNFWLGGIAALVLGRSTPLLAFAVYWVSLRRTVLRLYLCILAAVVYLSVTGIPGGSGRFVFWRQYWSYWVHLDPVTKIFGTHFGMTAALLPVVQSNYPLDQYFIWLHNDYFQALAEFGIVGFLLCAAAGVEIFRKCSRHEKAMGLALAAGMLTNFPWHWMPEALLYWYWVKKNAVEV